MDNQPTLDKETQDLIDQLNSESFDQSNVVIDTEATEQPKPVASNQNSPTQMHR